MIYNHYVQNKEYGRVKMKKKFKIAGLAVLIIFLLAAVFMIYRNRQQGPQAVNQTESSSQQSETEGQKSENNAQQNTNNVQEADNIAITLKGATIENIVGNRDANNKKADKGEYFNHKGKALKASDYEYIVLNMNIENKSDKTITFSRRGWIVTLPDGNELKDFTVTAALSSELRFASSSDGKIKILKEKSTNIDKFELKYNLLNYDEEWNKMNEDIVNNKLSNEQAKAKYGDKLTPKEMKFNVVVKK